MAFACGAIDMAKLTRVCVNRKTDKRNTSKSTRKRVYFFILVVTFIASLLRREIKLSRAYNCAAREYQTLSLACNRNPLSTNTIITKSDRLFIPLALIFFFQAYPLLLSIVKEGGHLGLQECQKQFKNEIWNCTLDNKHVFKELPIFVKTTLPYGKLPVSSAVIKAIPFENYLL